MLDVSETRLRLNRLMDGQKSVSDQFRSDQLACMKANDEMSCAEDAQKIIQVVSQTIQQAAHERIASVVSRCLEAVFDEPYQFKIVFEQKRGRTEAQLVFVRDGLELTDPLNEAGGGVIDVAAFALRLACLVLERPVRRRVLVLDEPFSKIRGKQNRQRMRGLLESLAEDFGLQMVINIDGESYPEMLLGGVVDLS